MVVVIGQPKLTGVVYQDALLENIFRMRAVSISP